MRESLNILLIGCAFISPILIKSFLKKQSTRLLSSIIAFVGSAVLMSAFFIGSVFIDNYLLEKEVEKLDRNGDGFYTASDEATWTTEDYNTMAQFAGDGGRNVFAVYFFPIFSVVYTAIIWIIIYIIGVIRKNNMHKRKIVT